MPNVSLYLTTSDSLGSRSFSFPARRPLAIHETLPITEALQHMIMRNPSRDELTAYLRENEVPSLYEDGVERAREQLTTVEEVARVVNT